MVFDPFHYCAFCERAAPDAPETIDDQRRCTRCRYRTIYGGPRGSASLPRRRSCSALYRQSASDRLENSQLIGRPPDDITIICETVR
jgi:hypothetical protein